MIDRERKQELLESKHFCILPFVHVCIWTDGRAIPCCISNYYELGNVKIQRLDDIYSNDNSRLRQLRQQMINGPELPLSCRSCRDMEANYTDKSLRYYSNRSHGRLLDSIEIDDDGTVVENKVSTWDVRFSNLCNLKCRICSPVNSSKIAKEEQRFTKNKISILQEAFKNREDFFDFFKKNIDGIEEIYFCGGEPLMLEEHYEILDLLIKNGKFDTVLRYNTNCTTLTFRDKNVVTDYWTRFKNIHLSLSIDAGWQQLHYIRGGARWSTILKNIRQIVEYCPHAFVQLSPTVEILNAFHVKDMHLYLIEHELIELNNVFFNILTYPNYYSLTALPSDIKMRVKQHWLDYRDTVEKMSASNVLLEEINKVIKYIDVRDHSNCLDEFRKQTKIKDIIRRENFNKIFPELSELFTVEKK